MILRKCFESNILIGLVKTISLLVLFIFAQNVSATTDIKICSKSETTGTDSNVTGYYNINGTNTLSLREKLANSDYFGSDGDYGDYNFSFTTYSDPAAFTADKTSLDLLLASCDIWYSGNEANADYTADQLDAVLEFAQSGKVIVASCNDNSHDLFCSTTEVGAAQSSATGSLTSSVEVFVPGLTYIFDDSGTECNYITDEEVDMADNLYFTLAADGTNLSTDTDFSIITSHTSNQGFTEPPATSFAYEFSTEGFVVGFADYAMMQNSDVSGRSTLSPGSSASNNNDIFIVSMFSRFGRYIASNSTLVFGSNTSIGNAISIATTNDEGESSVAQAFSRPIFVDKDTNGLESDPLYWTGEMRLFFIDGNGIFREDTDGSGSLDAKSVTNGSDILDPDIDVEPTTSGSDRAFKLVYSEEEHTTQLQYLTVTLLNDGSVDTIVNDGEPVDSEDMKAIWSANEAFQLIGDNAATNLVNRSYTDVVSAADGNGRYIFTTINGQEKAFIWNSSGTTTSSDINSTNVAILNVPTSLVDLSAEANTAFSNAITAYNGANPEVITTADDLAVFLGYASIEDLLDNMKQNGKNGYKTVFIDAGYMTSSEYDAIKDKFNDPDLIASDADLVGWVRGDDSAGIYRSRTSNVTGRRYLFGDIDNSNPVQVIEPSGASNLDSDYLTFKSQYIHRRRMVYVGSNDGMLHAFNGGFWDDIDDTFRTDLTEIDGGSATAHPLGAEIWAYVPENALPKLIDLASEDFATASGELEPENHFYFVDGSIQSFDVKIFSDDSDHPGGWGTILVAATGYGGHGNTYDSGSGTVTTKSSLIVFDVTNPEVVPTVISVIDDANLDMTTTRPTIYKTASNTYLAFGSGVTDQVNHIDSVSNAPRFYLFDLDAGASNGGTLNSISLSGAASNTLVGNPEAVDWDNDEVDDAIYFGTVEQATASDEPSGDLRMYYFDSGVSTNISNAGHIYTILEPSAPISVKPHLSIDSNDQQWITVGTGKSYSAGDISKTGQQYFIGLKQNEYTDTITSTEKLVTSTINFSTDLQNVNGVTVDSDGDLTFSSFSPIITGTLTADIDTIEEFVDYIALVGVKGWKLSLDTNDPGVGSERVTSPAISIRDLLLFSTFQEVGVSSVCSVTGSSLIYGVDLRTGLRYLPDSGSGVFIEDDDDPKISTDAGKGIIDELTLFIINEDEARVLGPNDLGEIPVIDIRLPSAGSVSSSYGRKSWTEIEF